MTIDSRDVNELGPAKFRTQADKNREQIWIHNRNKKDKTFNSFLVVRKQTSTSEKIIFSNQKIIYNITKNNAVYSEIGDELNNFNNDNVQFEQLLWGVSERDIGREETDGAKWRYSDYDRRISKNTRFLSK